MWLFGSLWDRWTIAFKIVTPLLHVAFSAAQMHGSYVFWTMYRRQQIIIMQQQGGGITESDEAHHTSPAIGVDTGAGRESSNLKIDKEKKRIVSRPDVPESQSELSITPPKSENNGRE
jgi:hypothetical protein